MRCACFKTWPIATVLAALVPCGVAQVNAAALSGTLYEPFDYTTTNNPSDDTADGDLVGNTGGSGWGGAWSIGTSALDGAVTSPTLSYGTITGTGNKATLVGAGSSAINFRSLGQTVDSGTVFLSAIMGRNTSDTRTIGIGLYSDTTSKLDILGTNNYVLQLNGGTVTAASSPIDDEVQRLVVLRIDFNASGNETINLYLPTTVNASAGPGTAYITKTDTAITSFNSIRLFAGATNAGSGGTGNADFDEIRIGSTYADVVPEPTAGVALFAATAIVACRRRCRS